jgi:hypothetical protein
MVLTLYGAPYSTCTQRILMTLHEKQVPYEFVLVDLKIGAQKVSILSFVLGGVFFGSRLS